MTPSDHDTKTYRPIPCAAYDVYEIAIMRHQRLRLVWGEADVVYEQVATPLDLETVQGSEFLIVTLASGARHAIRLDWIQRVEVC